MVSQQNADIANALQLAFYMWGADWHHLANTNEWPCVAVMQPYVKLL